MARPRRGAWTRTGWPISPRSCRAWFLDRGAGRSRLARRSCRRLRSPSRPDAGPSWQGRAEPAGADGDRDAGPDAGDPQSRACGERRRGGARARPRFRRFRRADAATRPWLSGRARAAARSKRRGGPSRAQGFGRVGVGLRRRRLRFARRRHALGARPLRSDGGGRRRAPVRLGEAHRRQRGAARRRPRPRAGRRRDRAGRGVGGPHPARRPLERFAACRVFRRGQGARRPCLRTPARARSRPRANPDVSRAEEAVNGPGADATALPPPALTGELSIDRLRLADLAALALGPAQPASRRSGVVGGQIRRAAARPSARGVAGERRRADARGRARRPGVLDQSPARQGAARSRRRRHAARRRRRLRPRDAEAQRRDRDVCRRLERRARARSTRWLFRPASAPDSSSLRPAEASPRWSRGSPAAERPTSSGRRWRAAIRPRSGAWSPRRRRRTPRSTRPTSPTSSGSTSTKARSPFPTGRRRWR